MARKHFEQLLNAILTLQKKLARKFLAFLLA